MEGNTQMTFNHSNAHAIHEHILVNVYIYIYIYMLGKDVLKCECVSTGKVKTLNRGENRTHDLGVASVMLVVLVRPYGGGSN